MIRGIHLAILAFAIIAAASALSAQTISARKLAPAPLEFTLSYSADRATGNAGSVFWLQGGKAEFNAPLNRTFSLVGELAAHHVSGINSAGQNLGLVSYLFGIRFSCHKSDRFTPFAQFLVGGVHGFDAYFPTQSSSLAVPDALALAAGGGLNIAISPSLALRPIQADYFQTQLPNDAANRENNLRLAAGIVLLIGPR